MGEKKENENRNETLAMEIIREQKEEIKRAGERNHKVIKMQFIIIIVLILAFLGSNIGWLIYESQYETVTEGEQSIEDIDNSENSEYTQTIK